MQVAVITGAASGIGLALTQVCLEKGMFVVMVDKNESALAHEIQQLNQHYTQQILSVGCDITKPQEVQQLAHIITQQVKRVDWLFNNAGIIGSLAPIWDVSPQSIHQVMDVNLYGMIHVIQALMPFLFSQSHTSRIINIASLYGVCSGGQVASYAMSKHAVLALSESLYYDLKRMDKPVDISVAFPSFSNTSLLSSPSSTTDAPDFHHILDNLLAHARSAKEIAQSIINEVEENKFYIFPDEEVKEYGAKRTQAMLEQTKPHLNEIEQLIQSLIKRNDKKRQKELFKLDYNNKK